ncbi:MAG: glycosyltransferase family 2 protein [Sulfitobacter sp.]|nr:glycosyltransferase family 2 protein [Sulfitobacter sp.]
MTLFAVMRNGAGYLDSFLSHYRDLGVRHFVLLDAASQDGAADHLAGASDVTLLQTDLSVTDHLDSMRAHLTRTFGTGRWCLCLELDELLEVEGLDRIGLPGLVRYLEGIGATAMSAQVLEMFPKTPMDGLDPMHFRAVIDSFLYYEIAGIDKYPYHGEDHPLAALTTANEITDRGTEIFYGGLWARLFDEHRCLTRHPLFFNGPDVRPEAHPQVPTGVICGDVGGVIRSYRLLNPALAHSTDQPLFTLDARRWNRVELLTRAGIVRVSDRYRAHLAERAS